MPAAGKFSAEHFVTLSQSCRTSTYKHHLDSGLQCTIISENPQTLSKFQAIQFKLADMAMKIELARNMVYKAAWLKDVGRSFTKEASMCKLYASEICCEVADQAIQIHGGYGYMKEYEVERYLRDGKLTEIGEGTSEIQRMVIARQIGC